VRRDQRARLGRQRRLARRRERARRGCGIVRRAIRIDAQEVDDDLRELRVRGAEDLRRQRRDVGAEVVERRADRLDQRDAEDARFGLTALAHDRDELTVGVDHRTTRVARVHRDRQLNAAIVVHAADIARRRRWKALARIERIARHRHTLRRSERRRRVRQRHEVRDRPRDREEREVVVGIDVDDPRRHRRRLTREHDGDRVRALHHVPRREDQPIAADHHAAAMTRTRDRDQPILARRAPLREPRADASQREHTHRRAIHRTQLKARRRQRRRRARRAARREHRRR